MERIESLHRAHAYRPSDAELRGRKSFVSPASPDRDVSSPTKGAASPREARERDAALFASHRSRLLGIAHRMLGSRADAEDLVQDVYLRWNHSTRDGIESPIAFLVTITTRLCLDRLRESKRQCTQYFDQCNFEQVVEERVPSPEMQLEFSEEVSMAFLAVLERLAPEEKAAFLLHDVLDYEYGEMARMLGKTEPACRQIVHRARARLRDPHARVSVSRDSCERVVKKFLTAIGTGDREAVIALLAEEVQCMALWINTHFLFDRGDRPLQRPSDDGCSGPHLSDGS